MTSVYFQVQLGFLLAVSRRSRDSQGVAHTEFVHGPTEPLLKHHDFYFKLPKNSDYFRVLPQDYLVQAQWAVDQFEVALYEHDLTTADFRGKLEVENELESWTVEFDGNVQEDQSNQYDWIGLKLTSPAFRPANPFPEKDWKTIMDILHKKFLTVANSDTRLGIKVVIPKRNAGLDQLKAIASMIWLLDPLLGDIHPPHCGPGSIRSLGLQYADIFRDCPLHLQTELASTFQVEDPWNNRLSPSRRPLELLSAPGELRQVKYCRGAGKILSADSIEDLVRLLDITIQDARDFPHARPAYSFFVHRESETIDINFNQHCGTLDIIEIMRWATLCVELTQYCLNKHGTFLYESYPGLNYTSTIFDFLKEQGLEEVSRYFESKTDAFKVPDLKHWPLIESTVARDDCPLGWETSPKNIDNSRYSFGIELEFYIPVMPVGCTFSRVTSPSVSSIDSDSMEDIVFEDHADVDDLPDPHPEDDRQVGRGTNFSDRAFTIAELISSKGPLTLMLNSYLHPESRAWKKKLIEHGVIPVNNIPRRYQTWTITYDGSLATWPGWAGYLELSGLEIVSRVLRDTPKGWEEVLNMVSVLRNNFRLTVTKSCGFHIHVGKGTDLLTLHLLRKVSVLMCCAENILYHLCCPGRRHSQYTSPLTGLNSTLGDSCTPEWLRMDVPADFEQHVPVDKLAGHRILGMLKKLWTASSKDNLSRWLRPNNLGSKSSMSIASCRSFDGAGENEFKGTVEFRYLEGTLEPELILRWSQLMVSLFQFADMASPQAWQVLVPTALQCREFGSLDTNVLRMFLVLLGLGNDYDFWVNRIERISKLPIDIRPPPTRPYDNHEILSCIDEPQIDALREGLCHRERRVPCLYHKARKQEVIDEPQPPTDPESVQ